MKPLKFELKELYFFLKRNYSLVVIIGGATLFLALKSYHLIWSQWSSYLIYYFLLPLLVIVFLLRRNPLDFGFRPGKPRIWGLHVGVVIIIGLPVLFAASRLSIMRDFYTIEQFSVLPYSLEIAATLFAWEFLFRGFLIFGLKEKLGEAVIIIQMVPFALTHIGKPEIETLSTILTGIYFGYIVYRGGSYWPAFIIHLFINLTIVYFVNLI